MGMLREHPLLPWLGVRWVCTRAAAVGFVTSAGAPVTPATPLITEVVALAPEAVPRRLRRAQAHSAASQAKEPVKRQAAAHGR